MENNIYIFVLQPLQMERKFFVSFENYLFYSRPETETDVIISQDGNETNSSESARAVSVSSCEIRGAEITEREEQRRRRRNIR